MSDESDPNLKAKRDPSEGSSSNPSLYSITQEVKKRALSAFRKKLPSLDLELDPQTKAKTEMILTKANPKPDPTTKPSTVADYLADDDEFGRDSESFLDAAAGRGDGSKDDAAPSEKTTVQQGLAATADQVGVGSSSLSLDQITEKDVLKMGKNIGDSDSEDQNEYGSKTRSGEQQSGLSCKGNAFTFNFYLPSLFNFKIRMSAQ
jgi:hypothetical protein